MKGIQLVLGSFFFVAILASISNAQQRTFVSGVGSDGNPCSRTAPCRTFAQALTVTAPGGEVVALDTAGYGTVAITKSVSIIAPPGVYAGMSVFSGDGIDITSQSSDTFVLRGLTIINQGGNGSGIVFSANVGGTLRVENCVISGFGAGLLFQGPGKLGVKDSSMSGNSIGIIVAPSTGTAGAVIEHIRLEGNTEGLHCEDGSQVTIRDATVSGNIDGLEARSLNGGAVQLNVDRCAVASNSQSGIRASGGSAASVEINVESCTVSNNGFSGVIALATSTGATTIRISNSMVTDNMTGLANGGSPAVILSRGNNTVEGNGTNTSGTIGSYTAK